MDLLLPVCISLAALGLVVTIVLWLRGRRGRALQAFGFAALPVGLYLTGLLGLVFDAVSALGGWAAGLILNPAVWAGFGLLGIAVVLWVIGGLLAKRTRSRRPAEPGASGRTPRAKTKDASPRAVGKDTSAPTARPGRDIGSSSTGGATADSEFDDIEELLRRRGIE